ncbi:hypothetical protein PVAND_006129 [Polypedilum vanderplanki]|uniref:E3 ubiquitin-protein ligase RNF10 n=1 Tax=Polypedilum vanderplanki TaxID=319348 RepID=A0A9J6C266_POLVA|nr:hypothetical protein PVAND_006129 [Polypedilum vanderplanki]
MEKKRNQAARIGQTSSDFKKDVSSKQHYRRRKETFQAEYGNNNNKQQQQSVNKYRKNANNNNFFYDKRPPARKNGYSLESQNNSSFGFSSSTRLTVENNDDYELNSVFNHGSKKQNLNHLLNFHKYTKDSDDMHYRGAFSKHGYRYRVASKKYNYNKEQYLQANCQFIVKEDAKYDYKPFKITPDALVEWDQIVKILISSNEESQCPICLYPPKAARMTKCGHVFCFSCALHYLSLSDKKWRKCPICYESVYLTDLKSTTSRHIHGSYKVGDILNMELMKRERGSLFVNKANETGCNEISEFPSFSEVQENFTYSKLIMANKQEILKIIEKEIYELDFQLIEDGIDCPESIFVQQAIDLLNNKKKEIEMLIEEDEKLKNEKQYEQQVVNSFGQMTISSNISTTPSVSSTTESLDDELHSIIDEEECTLTVKDIDITSESSNSHSQHFYYYQAPNSQNIFLHSINSKMLQLMYGSLEKSPQTIRGKIVQIECCSMNEDLRKRLKYLQHLPVSSVFEVVEIEFEEGFISEDVIDVFKDDLLNRRKKRQRREREEKKREKVINEINDRQMGKMLSASAANIDICSSSQFPEYYEFQELVNESTGISDLSTSPAGLPSFANMLTSPTGHESEKLWPSLATPTSSSNATNCSNNLFFDDAKMITRIAENKASSSAKTATSVQDDHEYDDDEDECKAPVYKNNLSDALANALKSKASQFEANQNKSGGKNKKKGKKTLLFSSGMNFN